MATKTPTTLSQLEQAYAQNRIEVPAGELSAEQCRELGRSIMGWLSSSSRTLPKFDHELLDPAAHGISDRLAGTLTEMAYLTPVLYLAVCRQGCETPVVPDIRDQGSHMWLNAFSCVHPTDETYQEVGRWVSSLLASDDTALARINKS